MSVRIPKHLEKKRDVTITKEELIEFETEVKNRYEDGEVKAPIHLAKDNEDEFPLSASSATASTLQSCFAIFAN
mgnify:CR=1 FL=1